jgi:hypothetical protein
MGKHRVPVSSGRQKKLKEKQKSDGNRIRAKPTGKPAVARRAAQESLPGKERVASMASV